MQVVRGLAMLKENSRLIGVTELHRACITGETGPGSKHNRMAGGSEVTRIGRL